MFPGQLLSHEEFIQDRAIYNHWCSERDAVSIPIVREFVAGAGVGLALEPMLQYVCEIANKPDVYQYHVLG